MVNKFTKKRKSKDKPMPEPTLTHGLPNRKQRRIDRREAFMAEVEEAQRLRDKREKGSK